MFTQILKRLISLVSDHKKEKFVMTQFNSPCTDHRNCTLDIKRLREDTRNGRQKLREEHAAAEKRKAACDAALQEARKIGAPNMKELAEAAQAANNESWFLYHLAYSTDALTFVSIIKAHHRGRLHGNKRRLPDGKKIEWTKECQAELIATGKIGGWELARYAQKIVGRYQKAVVAAAKVA